ncbi:MAG: glycoside hydrolase family 9 protein [Fibromonadaceae bacterium]|jgi:hypothetical protein|nr:glycoside hydrolase family 9 protein [Fibromonadaceae bacterium]
MHISFRFFAVAIMVSFLSSYAGVWLRVNQAGYTPERVKTAVVLSDTDIAGEGWSLKKDGTIVTGGTLSAGKESQDYYVKQKYYYTLDFSDAQEKGTYTLELAGAEAQQVIIGEDPYSLFATQALMHLRAMRSGGPSRLNSEPTHLGDSAAIVYIVDGNWEDGNWKKASPEKKVKMQGGHYDAGDYIKFTLNEAYLAWHLLTAYRENPSLFVDVQSPSNLPDILDEAKHSLDYLAKTFPDNNTFVIQVGDGNDHDEWPVRLPENDKLEGKRPALCALSRVHMGSTAAALALGAQVFKDFDETASVLYEERAKAIYARARQNGTQVSAYENNNTNEFYRVDSDTAHMALAAAELYDLTKTQSYLDEAIAYNTPRGYEVGWSEWNSFTNHRLAVLGNAEAKTRLNSEVASYNRSANRDNVWNLTSGYTWASLHRWIGAANAYERRYRLDGTSETAPFLGVLDYTFGCNNWGIAMVASKDLPYSIRNVYNTIYILKNEFPLGALSEGPGQKNTHNNMKKWFDDEGQWSSVSTNAYFEEFNTNVAVFYDNQYDFVTQESTIGGQGDLILMLALAAKNNNEITSTLPPKVALREPASLSMYKANSLFFFTPSQTCNAKNLTVFNAQGRHIATIYRNNRNQFIWNAGNAADGIYQVRPSDGSPVLTVKK